MDDASRKGLSGIESETVITNKLAIKSFKKAEKKAEERNLIILQVNTDRGPEFFLNKKEMNKDSKSEFELYLRKKRKTAHSFEDKESSNKWKA